MYRYEASTPIHPDSQQPTLTVVVKYGEIAHMDLNVVGRGGSHPAVD